MNRRRFILSSAAGLTLIGHRAATQRASTATTVVVSEFTGAEIDFTESGFTLEAQKFEPNAGTDKKFAWEQFSFKTGTGNMTLDLFTAGSQDLETYLFEFTQGFNMLFGIEEHAYADIEGGGYSAFSYETSAVYVEYQLGAFPDVDLIVTFTAEQASFQEEFAKMQTIMVGGAAPCLFTVESKVEEIVFAGAATTTTTGSRTTRGTTTTGQTTTTAGNTSQTSSTPATTGSAGSESDYVAAIIAHRDAFLESYSLFMDHLAIVGEETTAEAEKADLFNQMYEIALDWKAYPDDAAALTAPASLADLGTLYGEWAVVIGDMGSLFEELYNGVDTIDAFIAAISEWELLDAELQVELEAFGFQGAKNAAGAIKSIRSGLKATWRSVH